MANYTYGVVRIDDSGYPAHLRAIEDAPEKLYYIGDLSLAEYPVIGIVGTRKCSPYGKWAAGEISRIVARCGISVASGMAEGIDSAAHWGCISEKTPTIAVLGTGVDVVFPKSNSGLYDKIASSGLILSEFPPGTPGYPSNFPRRNRIISGLCKSVIVVEGAIKSGSMITARLAMEQGRDVFAVPGNINQPKSKGVNKLIADGAYPIMDLDEVPKLLGISMGLSAKRIDSLSDEEKIIVGTLIEAPGETAEYVAFKSGIPIHSVNSLITSLQLKSVLYEQGQRFFVSN